MAQPWLSVITPTYNGEAYLSATLDSILLQEDNDIECIAVDGGSTDATLAILQTYQQRLPMRILRREEASGWAASTNHALSLAQGKTISFLHQDDVWFKGRLKTMKRMAAQFPEAVLFLHASRFIDKGGKSLGRWSCPLPADPHVTKPELMIERLLVQNFISIPGAVFQRETALRVGGLDETLWYTADWDFWLKIAACGDALYHPEPLSGFRIHPDSQTVVRTADLQDRRDQLESVFEKHFAAWRAPERLRNKVRAPAKFSIEVNLTLAGMLNGTRAALPKLLISFLSLGPAGGHRYLRDSRIRERTVARMRARLLTRSKV